MDKLLLCVRYILVIVCLEVVISHGDSCECDAISLIFSKEIFSLKVENVKLNSRIETIEAMLRERKEMQPSLTGKDAAQVRLLDEEQARLELNLERKDLNNLLRKAFSAEKKERRRSDLKIEEGLGRLNRSLKEFDEQAKALIVSHENTMSRVIQEFKNKSAEIGANIRKDVLSVVEKLGNQTEDFVNSRTTLERAIEDISQNVSRMDADMNSVIDIVLLDQRAECEPNCTNGGVCFMDGSCRCKPLTEGGHCERFICTDRCYENGGECEGPGLCKCPERQNGYNCEHKDCVLPVNVAKNGSGGTYKIGEFLHVLCNNGYGLSSRSTDEVTCLTTGTWSGTVECDEIDECAPQPCIHGSCSDGIGEYTCSCFTGYSGQKCDKEIDECAPQPCIHGSCSDGIGEYTCSCFTGYSGQKCDTEIDECAPQPCKHGSCSDGIGEYTCSCFTGYSGQNCDTEIDECAPQPCTHGLCSDGIGEYTCSCFTGYSGQNCDTEIDECAPQPCIQGSCSDGIGEYTCSCFTGYNGQNCTEIDECAPQPCIHGSCSDGIGEYTCSCFTGYSDQNCDKGCGKTVSRAEESCGDNHQRKLALWVKRVTGFSSQDSFSGWAADRVIGCPDVYPGYGYDYGQWFQAYAHRNQNSYIEVEFDVNVNVISVDIYETLRAGAVTAISGLREDGIWQLLWSTDSPTVTESSRIFSPSLDVKDFQSSTQNIRIEVDNRASKGWVGIDAIRLHGCW